MITEAAGRAEREGALSGSEANLIKHIANGNAIRAVEIALQLTGNPGLNRRNPLERHYRDVLCSGIHSPQSDSILVTAGRTAFAR